MSVCWDFIYNLFGQELVQQNTIRQVTRERVGKRETEPGTLADQSLEVTDQVYVLLVCKNHKYTLQEQM